MRLTVLSGLPGAGKSTLARELAVGSKAEVASRDDLRKHFPDLSEGELTIRLVQFARSLLRHNKSVIVDSCNLHSEDEKRWICLANEFEAVFKWIHLPTPVEVCITRDAQRPSPNGEVAINATALQYASRLKAFENGAVL
jgi:predicted kinase